MLKENDGVRTRRTRRWGVAWQREPRTHEQNDMRAREQVHGAEVLAPGQVEGPNTPLANEVCNLVVHVLAVLHALREPARFTRAW
jgi:hypothetical protein